MNRQKRINLLFTIFIGLLALMTLFPVIYTISNSFMSPTEILEHYGAINSNSSMAKLHLLPDKLSLKAYYDVFLGTPKYLMKFWISLFLCAAIVSGQVIVSVMGGFAFAKYDFLGKKIWFLAMILFMIMPIQVTLLPNYIILDRFKLLNTYGALILPGIFLPFGTFLMTQIFKGIPSDVLEAGKLDGAGTMKLLYKIMIPSGKAGFATLIVLSFIDNWNMVEQPIVFLADEYQYPLSVFLASVTKSNFALAFVCGILSLIPVTCLFFFYQEELSEGLEISSFK